MQQKLVGRDTDAGLSLAEIVQVLWRRRFVLAATTVLGLAVGLALAKGRPPLFTASGILLVQLQQPSADGSAERIPPEWDVATERDAITSPAMLAAALARLPEHEQAELVSSGRLVDRILHILFPDPVEIAPRDLRRAATLDAIRRALVVEAGERSLALSVSLSGHSRTATANFVNALMSVYLGERQARTQQQQDRLLDQIASQRLALQRHAAAQTAEIERLQRTPGSEFALQQAQASVRELSIASQALALEAERIPPAAGDAGAGIAAAAVPPARASGAKTLVILLGASILFTGSTALAIIARWQRRRRSAIPNSDDWAERAEAVP